MNLFSVNWGSVDKIGGIGLAVIILFVGYKMFQLFISQWKNSTEAVNNNTTAFQELSRVFERANEREIEWQKEAMEIMKDTNKKVKDIHDKVV
jgi:hypothetical protein